MKQVLVYGKKLGQHIELYVRQERLVGQQSTLVHRVVLHQSWLLCEHRHRDSPTNEDGEQQGRALWETRRTRVDQQHFHGWNTILSEKSDLSRWACSSSTTRDICAAQSSHTLAFGCGSDFLTR